jgi:YD repeat-containing protein
VVCPKAFRSQFDAGENYMTSDRTPSASLVLRTIKLLLITGILLTPLRGWAQAPSISSISPTSGPVGLPVTISGTNFGATQGSSTVTLNGTSATVTNWSSTSIVAIVPSNATTGTFSVTVNSQAANSTSFTVTALPSGWSDTDIGSVGIAGSSSYANGVFTVNGAGAQIWSTSDSFHFVYQSLSGDGTIIARLVSSPTWATPGIMIRGSLNTNAMSAFDGFNGSNVYFNYRTTTGGSTSQGAGPGSLSLPYWLKASRSGSTLSVYGSADGVNWTQIGSNQTISMGQNVDIGLVMCSNSTSTLATATFDNVSFSPAPAVTSLSSSTGLVGSQVVISGTSFGSTQGLVTLSGSPMTISSWSNTSVTATVPAGATSGPLVIASNPGLDDSNSVAFAVLPPNWADQDIGQAGIAGTSSYANGVFTVKGAGAQIWSTSDSFHFAYQSLSGDGTIVARLVSVSPTSATPGIMIRDSLNTNAMSAFAGFNGSNVYFNYRTTTGGSTSQGAGPGSLSLPYWLKVSRSGSTLSAYASYDGENWSQIGSSQTINMGQNVDIGLVMCSNSTSTLATATFDSVSINSSSAPAPLISSVSANTGSVGSQVVISGSGFGASQGNSAVLVNDGLMTVNYWSATSIIMTIASGATSGPLVVSMAPSDNDSNAVDFVVTSQPLPSPWVDEDIGQVGIVGSSTYASSVFTVKGAGAQIWSTSDSFHFVYQTLSGDGMIVARLASVSPTSATPGIMIRDSLNINAMSAFAGFNGSNVYFNYRTTTGGSTSQGSGPGSLSVPYWLKVSRSGSDLIAYSSSDGVSWSLIGSYQTINMGQNVDIGLVMCSNSTSTLATATFDHVLTYRTGEILGTITKASDGTALSGASIQAMQWGAARGTATSDSSGNYAMYLPGGSYDIKVSASGYGSSLTNAVFVPAASVTILNVSLSSPGSVSGTVTQSNGVTPIQGAIVQALVGDASLASVSTGSNGTYTISGLSAGTYQVQASASGFVSAGQSASVTANGTATANFSLQAQSSGAVSYVYDPIGRLVGVINPGGNTAVYNYDAVGNLLSISRQSSSSLAFISFGPGSGSSGSAVTIYGTGFNTTASQNTVKFNGMMATVTSASATQLSVIVPLGASTGTISVTTSAGTVTSSSSFTVTNP